MLKKNLRAIIASAAVAGTSFGFVTLALGAQQATGTVVHYKVIEKTFSVGKGQVVTVDLKCPTGMVPTGGGAHYGINSFPNAASIYGAYISESDLDISHRGWASTAVTASGVGPSGFTADVVCAVL